MEQTDYIKELEEKIKTLESQVKGRKKMTDEERRAKDREYKRRKYRENPDKCREKGLELYYKKKENNPDFHSRPVGRPRKVIEEVA